jgi:hypothetical protein
MLDTGGIDDVSRVPSADTVTGRILSEWARLALGPLHPSCHGVLGERHFVCYHVEEVAASLGVKLWPGLVADRSQRRRTQESAP